MRFEMVQSLYFSDDFQVASKYMDNDTVTFLSCCSLACFGNEPYTTITLYNIQVRHLSFRAHSRHWQKTRKRYKIEVSLTFDKSNF